MLYLYDLVVCRQLEGFLTMSKTLGMNSVLEYLSGSTLKVNMGQIDKLVLSADKLVTCFLKGVEMYLSFTQNSDPTVGSGIGTTCRMNLYKMGIKCKACNDFFLLAIAMARRICELNMLSITCSVGLKY